MRLTCILDELFRISSNKQVTPTLVSCSVLEFLNTPSTSNEASFQIIPHSQSTTLLHLTPHYINSATETASLNNLIIFYVANSNNRRRSDLNTSADK